jgi:hypothetical protein
VRRSRFRVVARLDMASRASVGTVTIDRGAAPLFSVRPLRRRRVYTVPLATVAEWVVRTLIAEEVRERRRARGRR